MLDCAFVITELIFDGKVKGFDECCDEHNAYCAETTTHKHHWEHVTHSVHICSIIVLSLFMVEVAAKIIYTRDHFLSHKMEIFDAVIVVTSFILDLVFINDDVVGGLVQLIMFLRFWRVVRVINGFILSAKQAADKRIVIKIEYCKTGLAKCGLTVLENLNILKNFRKNYIFFYISHYNPKCIFF